MAKGVKEIKELLAGVELMGVQVKKALADGRLSLADLQHLISLLTQFNVLVDAIQGLDEVPAEAKDLDAKEAEELIGEILKVVGAIRAA